MSYKGSEINRLLFAETVLCVCVCVLVFFFKNFTPTIILCLFNYSDTCNASKHSQIAFKILQTQ